MPCTPSTRSAVFDMEHLSRVPGDGKRSSMSHATRNQSVHSRRHRRGIRAAMGGIGLRIDVPSGCSTYLLCVSVDRNPFCAPRSTYGIWTRNARGSYWLVQNTSRRGVQHCCDTDDGICCLYSVRACCVVFRELGPQKSIALPMFSGDLCRPLRLLDRIGSSGPDRSFRVLLRLVNARRTARLYVVTTQTIRRTNHCTQVAGLP